MTRSRLGAVLLLLATFLLGGLLGGAATTLADHRAHKRHADRPRPGYVDRLAADLSLSEAQRDSIQAVLDRHQPAMDSLWQLIRPQFQSERQVIRNEITLLLTPEQQTKYRELQRQDSLRRAELDRGRNGRR
ncbi:MAG TPA: periplasmic heavy metal sensor [Gemmatimonadales bacterium]|jgi:Spy/CpxP family protein refolding chaperone|nr:periplasmic heavy metal sensor [Gemmatimonadales bacterium]